MWTPERESLNEKLAERGLETGESVYVDRIIDKPSDVIWNAISRPGELTQYHPYCQSNEAFKWPGVGSRDGLTYYSGIYFERDFKTWMEGIGYDLEIGPPPRKTAWISWRIKPFEQSRSKLSIEVTPYLESHLLDAVKLEFQRQYFGKSVEIYLDSFLRGVDYFVTTGRAVQAKQFGSHPIYAP
ncbi:hypothetical protein [Microcoleus sp. F4-D5]|uniref:hypothetical protein n=1 Tax=Microcoleus sp. F4-D5 TaxID=2818760 RepID=UPI002FCF3313